MNVGQDQRVSPRRRVMKGVKLAYGDFVFVQDCVVRDLSTTGARVTHSGTTNIPDDFYLVFPTERLMRRAVVMWRKGDELGVRFEGEPNQYLNDPDPRLRQFRQL